MLFRSGDQTTQSRRHFFHRERSAYAPFTTHADSKKRPQHEERPVARRESGSNFNHRVENEIDHQRKAPAVAVGEKAEEKCADGSENERHRNRQRHLLVGAMKFTRDGCQAVDDKEVIKGVEGPSEKARKDRRILI